MMKVKNMTSGNGKEVTNQFILTDGNKITFQSYNSPIVEIDYDKKIITVFKDWDYSTTTGKYRNKFMSDNGFVDMENKKGFEYYMNLGAIGNFEVIKDF